MSLMDKLRKGQYPEWYWIIGREKDKHLLEEKGVQVGPLERDATGQPKRGGTNGELVTWGKCYVPNIEDLFDFWQTKFIWGPDAGAKENQ